MSEISRRDFIHQAYWETLGLVGSVSLLSCAKKTAPAVHATSGATPKVSSMPSINRLKEKYSFNDTKLKQRINEPVAVVKSSIAAEAAYNVLALLKPTLRGDRVFIKANYSTYPFVDPGTPPKKPEFYYMAVTQPDFVFGIMNYLHDQGIKYENITVGDGIGESTTARLEYLGYFEQAKKMGFKVLDITKDAIAGYKIEQGGFLPETGISKTISDHIQDGVFIGAPKLKVHHFATTTTSLKNMMGIILPYDKKYIMHAELNNQWGKGKDLSREKYFDTLWSFSKRVIDLYTLAPDFSVVDGVIAGEGHGVANEYKGNQVTFPVEAHRAFASTNSINLDAVAAYFMGYNPMQPDFKDLPELKLNPWLYLAQKKTYGYMDVKKIKVVGDPALIEPEKKFALLPEIEYVKFQEKIDKG